MCTILILIKMSIHFHRNNFETLLFILHSYLLQSLIKHTHKIQIKKLKYFIPIINILIHLRTFSQLLQEFCFCFDVCTKSH